MEAPPKTTKLSLILAVSKNKIYGGQLFDGSIKGSDFGLFIINILKFNSELMEKLDNVYFYIDNA